jgi:hypothetical protein
MQWRRSRSGRKRRSTRLKLLNAGSILALLSSGCAVDTAQTVEPSKICKPWKQINIRTADKLTPETAGEIEQNNVGREAFGCPYEPPLKRVAGK